MSPPHHGLKKNYRCVPALQQFYTGGPFSPSPSAALLACACGDEIKLIDAASAALIATLESDSESVTALTFGPDDRLLFSASHRRLIRVWDLDSFKCIRSWKGHDGPVMGMACHGSGGLLATAGADKRVCVWDVDGGFCTHFFRGHQGIVTSIMFHSDPKRLLSPIPLTSMATAAEIEAAPNAATSTIRRLLLLKNRLTPSDRNPFIADPPSAKKKPFAALRGLGCASASSSQVFAPAAAAVRSSADWPGKRSRRRRVKQKKKPKDLRRPAAAATSDVWCAPGIAFAADAPVDCVVRGGRADSDRVQVMQRSCVARRGGGGGGGNQERLSAFIDASSDHETPLFGSDVVPSGQLRHIRGYRRSPGGLEEIMMFQTRLLLGAIDAYDQYRDLRLDVDGMSYEELLELGDKIGYVSTGLREEEILCCLRKSKNPVFTSPSFYFSDMERKCCICQEEYEVNDEMGRLYCGHSYHTYCIKQWLLQKNACPVCKSVVSKG